MASDSSGLTDPQRRNELQQNAQAYITITKASQLPPLKERFRGKNRKFYITVTDGRTERKTEPIRSTAEQAAIWNERLGPFESSTTGQITLSLYSRRKTSKDELIGTLTIKSTAQTRASHPVECNLDPRPHIELTIESNGTSTSPMTQSTEGTAAMNNNPTDDAERGKAIVDVNVAINEAGAALSSMNLHDEWKSTLDGIQWVMGVAGDLAALNPYAKIAYDALTLLPKVLTAQFELDQNVQALSKAMRDAFNLAQAEELLKTIKPNSNQELILKLMLKHIKICSDVIQKYAEDKDFSKRLLKNAIGGVSAKIQGLCDTLLQLRDDLLRNAAISTQIGVEMVKKNVEVLSIRVIDIEYDAKIDDLPYKSGWTLTSNKNGCIAGTRTAFLERILEWVRDPSSERVLVLFGQAGTGKSTIAFEIASLFSIEYHICPYFSFSRADISKGEDYHLLTTIIRDLADHHSTFKSTLGALIKDKTHLRKSADFNTLFHSLLMPSLENVGDNDIPELLVIDAVDESSDPSKLAAFLARSLNRLPNNFRVLVTSRPEHDIKLEFPTIPEATFIIIEMSDPKLSASTEDDIRVYLQVHLSPSDFEQYGEALVKKSEGIFQWAVVAAGYLKKPPPGFTRNDCMRVILAETQEDKKYSHDLMTPLHTLYTTVLAGYFTISFTQSRFCSVMSQLFAAAEPISVDTLTGLRAHMSVGNDKGVVPAIVQYLGSLLSNTSSDQATQPIIPLHVSFRDFLINPDRRHTFSVDLPAAHVELAHACLNIMIEQVEFNICKLESSYLRNSEVLDLQVRIDKWIPPSLQYACQFWHQHLGQISVDGNLLDKLAMFFKTKFLNWLEVMSLICQIPKAVAALTCLIDCLHVGENATQTLRSKLNNIIDIVTDLSRFLAYFAPAIVTSAPHIYISSLPFTPTSSYISQTYSSAFPSTSSLKCGKLDQWPALEMFIKVPSTYEIFSVAVSPDGQWVVIGCDDHTVSLWSLTTGSQEGKPFIGHTHVVRSVTFSPNGQFIASASNDNTVRVWNLSRAEEDVLLVRHTDAVTSVVFSTDSKLIASGSLDCTVCLWETFSWTMLGAPLIGHDGPVNAVAFSPDGKYLVSGSENGTISLWNIATQTIEGQPFYIIHSARVNSVAFSPDGQKIVSGSDDNTVCIWDVPTQDLTEESPFEGHTQPVMSVSFSPHGKWVVSGSLDHTVCVWNMATGCQEGNPMTGQTGAVNSVAFTPDNRHVVSGSDHGTISVWNVPPPTMHFQDTFSGHTKYITSVAFSVDGQKIFSSSPMDRSIRIWSFMTQKMEGVLHFPDLNPSAEVYSSLVVCSPNGQWLAAGCYGAGIFLWDISTGLLHATLIGPTMDGIDIDPETIAFSPDGHYIAFGLKDSTICIWDTYLGTIVGKPFEWHKNGSRVCAIAISVGGQNIASVFQDGIIYIWNTHSQLLRQYSYTEYTGVIKCATVSPDGQQVAFGINDHSVHVVDLWALGDIQGHILKHPQLWLTNMLCFSPDGKMVACATPQYVFVWNVSTREGILLPGHTQFIHRVVFSPDGEWIVSCSDDGTIRVWPVPDLSGTSTNVGYSDPDFTDESIIEHDGWICGSEGELLMWIPPLHRTPLHRPSNVFILGEHETRLDTSRFVHGLNWEKCRG